MMIQSPARITSQCCHAPDDVNVNIARSESVPVQLQLADKMAGQQMSSYPRYPATSPISCLPCTHFLPCPCTQHTPAWTCSPATALKHKLLCPQLYNTKFRCSEICGCRRMQIFCVAMVQYKWGVCAGTRDICHWSPDTPTHCIHHCQGTPRQ